MTGFTKTEVRVAWFVVVLFLGIIVFLLYLAFFTPIVLWAKITYIILSVFIVWFGLLFLTGTIKHFEKSEFLRSELRWLVPERIKKEKIVPDLVVVVPIVVMPEEVPVEVKE